VLLAKQHDPKILGWSLRHSRHDPALMLRKCPLKPLAMSGGADQRVEEHSPVPVRQDKRFMLRNRPPSGIRERGHAEIRQFAPFELRRPFNQSFGRFVDTKAEPFFPKPSADLCWHCHGHLQRFMYVDWPNFSRCIVGAARLSRRSRGPEMIATDDELISP